MPSTIRLHRVLRAAPERVYRAFLDPNAMVKWPVSIKFSDRISRNAFSRIEYPGFP